MLEIRITNKYAHKKECNQNDVKEVQEDGEKVCMKHIPPIKFV